MIRRAIQNDIDIYLKGMDTKILFIWGPRRSGKTTILNTLAKKLHVRKFNFDVLSDQEKFIPWRNELQTLVSENSVILIDEVQNYPDATVVLKILHDEFHVKIIATGSSELRQKSSQPFDSLAGRYRELYCLPLSLYEIFEEEKPLRSLIPEFSQKVSNSQQIFGSYPEIYTMTRSLKDHKINHLESILNSYVLKDIIDIYDLKNAKLAKDILTKIALQLGSEVSLREIAKSLNANVTTVSNYIEIFIKNYVLIALPSFKTNARKAVSENRKLYFYDLGIRNALIQDFRDLDLRQDKGGVFENYIISELVKEKMITRAKQNFYFYREYGGKEIDVIIEDYQKQYQAVEIKSNKGNARNIFPLPHIATTLTAVNFLTEMKKLLVIHS